MKKQVISYSGGNGSAASVLLAHEHGLDYEVFFCDTLIEDEDLYRFNADLEKVIGKPINVLCDGRTPWDVFEDSRYIGNTRVAQCSRVLKTDLMRTTLKSLWRDDEYRLILGMAFGEIDRIERAQVNWNPVEVGSLLVDYKVNTRPEIEAVLARHGLKTPRLYEKGFPHNNCGGFCVRAGLKQFATLLEVFPERYAQHEARMVQAMEKIGPTARPFLRKQIDGVTHYLTLKEFREAYQAGTIRVDPYDFGGCACFVDED
jgi:hypothetical protein